MIQTEPTPNPNSIKFLSEKTISAIGTEEFQKNKSKNLKIKFIEELLDLRVWSWFYYLKTFYQ